MLSLLFKIFNAVDTPKNDFSGEAVSVEIGNTYEETVIIMLFIIIILLVMILFKSFTKTKISE